MTLSKAQFIRDRMSHAKYRAKKNNIPFDLDFDYLLSIAGDECPVFKTPFVWESSGLGLGKTHEGTPQLDRVIPELGYIKGNVAFLSGRANRMKNDGTMQDHYDIADWIWNQIHAKKKSTTSVPTEPSQFSEDYPQLGTVSSPWFRQDDDIIDDSGGAV